MFIAINNGVIHMKKQILLALSLVFTLALGHSAFADAVAVVDINELSAKYSKSVALVNQIKVKDQEIQKYRNTLLDQLKAAEKLSPLEKKALEEKLNTQFVNKINEIRDWVGKENDALQADMEKAIQTVAQQQKIDVVLPKQSVLQGGKDVTVDILNVLNKH
jgi:outer membrane protein